MKKIILNLINSNSFKIILLILSLIYSFSHLFWGIDFNDTFYYINQLPEYVSSPMFTGSLMLGYYWSLIFGNSLFSIRILSWLLGVLAIVLPYMVLLPKNQWIIKLHYLIIPILLSRNSIFGVDVVTLFIISLTLIFSIKYFQTIKVKYLLLLSITASMAIFVRFPNVLLFPVIIAVLTINKIYFAKQSVKIFFKELVFFGFFYFVVFCIISTLIFGNPITFVSNLFLSVDDFSGSSSHSFSLMIGAIYRELYLIFKYLGVLFLFDFFIQIYKKIRLRSLGIITLFFYYCLFFIFIYVDIYGSSYDHNLKLLFSALIFYIILKLLLINNHKGDYNRLLVYFLLVSFAFVVPMGSNTGLSKLSPLLLCYMPLLLIDLDLKLRQRLYLLPFAFLVLFLTVLTFTKPFEDSRINHLTEIVKSERKLQLIHTTPIRAKFIQDVIADYNTINHSKRVLFYGFTSPIFYYLTNEKSFYKFYYLTMSLNDYKDIKKFEIKIDKYFPTVFLLDDYPELVTKEVKYSKFETMLQIKGYHQLIKNGYKIYSKE